MLEKFADEQFMLWVLTGISTAALLQKIIVSLLYRRLKRQTDALPAVNDRWIRQLRLKFENTYKVNNQITDVGIFVDRQVAKLKFFKVGLHGLNTFYRKAQLICILRGGGSYILAARAGRTLSDCNVFFLMGVLAAVFIQLLDNLSGNAQSAEAVRLNLTDYFENMLLPKLGGQEDRTGGAAADTVRMPQVLCAGQEEASAEPIRADGEVFLEEKHGRREEIAAADLQKRLSRISGSKLTREEEDGIVRDVLREFLT